MTQKSLNVGITICVTPDLNIWSNGINQNIGLLVLCLSKSEHVNRIFLVNGGNYGRLPDDLCFPGLDVELVWPQDVTDLLDVVVEMGAILPIEWMRHAHACGVRFCCFGVGHNYSAVAELFAMGKGSGIYLSDPSLRTETWGLEQHELTCSPMMETLTRKPVFNMPHLWSPVFLERSLAHRGQSSADFGFSASSLSTVRKKGWRAAIFEPNIAVGKNCFIPILACEHAYRLDAQSIDHMMVMNSASMASHQTFFRFALNLDLNRDQKASYEPRCVFAQIMVEYQMNCVVTHQVEWGQNYLYYDALYGSYPLFHNSTFLKQAGVGLYYDGFSALEAGFLIRDAARFENDFWQDYKMKADQFLWTLDPENPRNIDAFSKRIVSVANAE
jgi:hypothetical protein